MGLSLEALPGTLSGCFFTKSSLALPTAGVYGGVSTLLVELAVAREELPT